MILLSWVVPVGLLGLQRKRADVRPVIFLKSISGSSSKFSNLIACIGFPLWRRVAYSYSLNVGCVTTASQPFFMKARANRCIISVAPFPTMILAGSIFFLMYEAMARLSSVHSLSG